MFLPKQDIVWAAQTFQSGTLASHLNTVVHTLIFCAHPRPHCEIHAAYARDLRRGIAINLLFCHFCGKNLRCGLCMLSNQGQDLIKNCRTFHTTDCTASSVHIFTSSLQKSILAISTLLGLKLTRRLGA